MWYLQRSERETHGLCGQCLQQMTTSCRVQTATLHHPTPPVHPDTSTLPSPWLLPVTTGYGNISNPDALVAI